jgi:hypothetical protein
MPNIISRYSHASFRRSLGRRRYSGRHGSSVPAMTGICNSDMFEISSASRKGMSSDAARGAPNCDSSEVLRTSGRKTLRPPGSHRNPTIRFVVIRSAPRGRGQQGAHYARRVFWRLSYGSLRTTFSYSHIKSPARYRRGIARIDGKTRRAYPTSGRSGGMRRCGWTRYRRTVLTSVGCSTGSIRTLVAPTQVPREHRNRITIRTLSITASVCTTNNIRANRWMTSRRTRRSRPFSRKCG